MFKAGDLIQNKYRLMEVIGQGGGGIIYKAYHLGLQKVVVLKKIKNNYANIAEVRLEVDILKNLHHAYLPQVYDFLRVDGEIFTVMEYIPGKSLEKYQQEGYRFSEEEIVKWTKQILDVLVYLHSRKPALYHNDIKPANIMITNSGNAFLIDFNISLTELQNDRIIGYSKIYASPEQIRKAIAASEHQFHKNIKIDGRSDLYSLGATFRMLMGKRQYSEGLRSIFQKATRSEPHDRYKNAAQMLQVVEHLEQQDHLYLEYERKAAIGRGIYLSFIMIALVLLIVGGIIQSGSDYEEGMALLAADDVQSDNAAMIEDGIKMLNHVGCRLIFLNNPNEKAKVLYYVGRGYENTENYKEAVRYFEEAMSTAPTSSDYNLFLRDCAIAEAKSGDITAARKRLSTAEQKMIGSANLDIVRGELAAADGDSKSAASYFKSAQEKAENDAVCIEALRRLGRLYVKNKNYSLAVSVYQKINGMTGTVFEDTLNLAILYEYQRNYSQSFSVLKKLAVQYPEDYRVYMCMARVSYEKGETTDAEIYYNKAQKAYGNRRVQSKDTEMEDLKKLIGQK